jgi:hypothetical protein
MIVALAFLATVGPTITVIDDSRFRVAIVFDDPSLGGHASAQVALIKSAQKACKGKGRATSEGALTLNSAAPIGKGRKAFTLSEVYFCQATK